MAKPRNRPAIVNSSYFDGVTPLWVAPGRDPVSTQFHAASRSLADWAGPDWSENEKSGFFSLREFLIDACEKWKAYDWDRDRAQIATRKQDDKHRETLARTTKAFRLALHKSAFQRAERDFGIAIAAALCPEGRIDLTYAQGCDAVGAALKDFETMAARRDLSPVQFGPLLYDTFPQRLPDRQIAVALVLADFVTGFRKDQHRAGGLFFPRASLLSLNLPWKAIAEYATAFTDDPAASINPENIATRVGNLHKKVARIYRHP
jgi:hypothetical protein